MTGKERSDIYEKVTARIIEQLETGTVPWRKPWKTTAGQGPCNANSKRPYRGFNLMVTLFSGYDSRYWATFKGWKKLGGSVRKGEKGTLVVGWKKSSYIKREEDEDGTTRDVKRETLVGFGYTVFNAEQVDGATIPERETVKAPELDPISAAQDILTQWEAHGGSPIAHGGDRACYAPLTDRITLPPFQSFRSAESYYHTAYHEVTHATGHAGRLDRFGDDALASFGSESYSKEELTAELGAAFLSASVGLAAETEEASAAYLEGWLSALRNDKRLLISAASKAQAAADYVLTLGETQEVREAA